MVDLYGGRDPRELPAYGIPEAAHYLCIPTATLRTWVRGRRYPTIGGPKHSPPVIDLADKTHNLLSFVNLTEAHILCAIRRHYRIPFNNLRRSLAYLREHFPSPHPLAEKTFETDGKHMLIKHLGDYIDISHEGQRLLPIMDAYLERIERDAHGTATRLYLFNKQDDPPATVQASRVVVDPRVAFGRPVLGGTRIVTEVVFQRFIAGESVAGLADDYGRPDSDIEEAIRCEQYRRAA